MNGILQGIRVLDFTRVLAGPFATRILADFGAEVIKVEPVAQPEEGQFERGYYAAWNRNKRAITLNPGKAKGLDLAKRLVAISDVVAENFTPRVMANWGLDYASLCRTKPDIIMLSMSLMGQTGLLSHYGGFAPTVHAYSGMTYLTTYPGKPPLGPGIAYADHAAGLAGALSVLGALEYRRKTGQGQHIDLSEVETMVSLLGDIFLGYQIQSSDAAPSGNASSQAAPHNVYPCRGEDRWCAIAIYTEEEWAAFKQVMGNPSWAAENRFATTEGRVNHADDLDRRIGEWTLQHDAEEIMALLRARGIRAGVVQNAADLAKDPQLLARGFFVLLNHPELGDTISDAQPMKLSRSPARYSRSAPLHGQDNDHVYRGLLGLEEPELALLRQDGII